jgi:cell division protein FtsX
LIFSGFGCFFSVVFLNTLEQWVRFSIENANDSLLQALGDVFGFEFISLVTLLGFLIELGYLTKVLSHFTLGNALLCKVAP